MSELASATTTGAFWSALENAINNQPNNLTGLTILNSTNIKSDNLDNNDEIIKLLNVCLFYFNNYIFHYITLYLI